MTNQIIRRLEQLEALMTPPDDAPQFDMEIVFDEPVMAVRAAGSRAPLG